MIKDGIARTPGGKPITDEEARAIGKLEVTVATEHHLDTNSGLASFARHTTSSRAAGKAHTEEHLWRLVR
jgi:hypothetical protein